MAAYPHGHALISENEPNRNLRSEDHELRLQYYTAMVAVAAAIVLIPGAPLGLITTAVQALAGLLLPSASVFLLLLCNDREVLGPWVNRPWLNVLAGLIVGVLLLLSGILMATTLFPGIDVIAVTGYLALVVLAAAAIAILRG